jgi:cobalt transporter subunit CbtA
MIGRVMLAALLAGIAAGLIMGVIQHVRLTPLILEAEKYEQAGGHDHAAGAKNTGAEMGTELAPSSNSSHTHDEEAWAPQDGMARTLFTTAASIVTGAGFAALLAGISILGGAPITARNGALWGLCGVLAFTLAPAAGLSPELPGMPAGDLLARQIWWLATIIATAAGIWLIAFRRQTWASLAAVVLIALPHIIGAPMAPTHESGVPAGLAAEFAANVLAVGALFWCLTGSFLGLAMDRFAKEASPHVA